MFKVMYRPFNTNKWFFYEKYSVEWMATIAYNHLIYDGYEAIIEKEN